MAAPAHGPGPSPISSWRARLSARAGGRLAAVVVLLLAALLPVGGATMAADDQPTRDQVQAFVRKAVDHARTHGTEAALADFTAAGCGPMTSGTPPKRSWAGARW